jgi:molecular chaperone Hsp33
MTDPQIAIPTRAPSPTTLDDTVMPFEVAKLDLRGRVVRLGPVVDEILSRHAYPQPVAKLLGEALVLTVMLGSALKIEGRFILQTQSDGPVRMLVVDFIAPDKVRACARFDKDRVAAAIAAGETGGAAPRQGHLAMTIDQGPDMNRYQGLVALDGSSLEDVAHEYFLRSNRFHTCQARGGRGIARCIGWCNSPLAGRRDNAAIPAQISGAGARCRSSSGRCPRGHRASHRQGR